MNLNIPHFANTDDLEALLDASEDPAILLDRDYRICASNTPYKAAFGNTTRGEFCYQRSHGYNRPCDQVGESCPLKQCIKKNEPQRALHVHNTPRGREHIDVEMTPVSNDLGEVTHFIEVMRGANRSQDNKKQMLGFSKSFNAMLELLNRAAPSNISILLLGETGTGKELAAHYLHEHSSYANKPFVTVECSGLTDTLFESELFGHEKGAFTGATHKKPGLIDAAAGGTLFLDEIGDVPLALQVKLLRLLETGTYRSVGSVEEKKADFRLVCATHQSLKSMVSQGRFRQDLFYRISSFPIIIPPLRERREDIGLIANHLLKSLNRNSDKKTFSKEALEWLPQQDYPGNVRELRNLIERAIILCDNKKIKIEHLQSPFQENPLQINASLEKHLPQYAVDSKLSDTRPQGFQPEPIKTLAQVEGEYLQSIASNSILDNTQLANQLGISERTLYRKLQNLKR